MAHSSAQWSVFEFDPEKLHGRQREVSPTSCPLTTLLTYCVMSPIPNERGVMIELGAGWGGEKQLYLQGSAFPQVNVLHSMNRVAHPSHVLSSQQFLHRGHQPPPEMAGHSLASSHRNSSA